MGLPAEGLASYYRNSRSEVLKYFETFHNGRCKIYNLCDDKQFDTSILRFETEEIHLTGREAIPVAYFPMMDHNPGSLRMLFFFCLDALLFLAMHPDNMISVHCKAGKGRTGVMICSFMMFMEGTEEATEAVEQFNFRRTMDNQGGLKIASQLRYIYYFQSFLQFHFKKPFKQILSQYIADPQAFDQLFAPSQILKLTSICIGPFNTNPEQGKGIKLQVKLYNFCSCNLFDEAISENGKPEYSYRTVFDSMSHNYFIMVVFNSLIVVEDDICVKIKSLQTPTQISPFKFRYWLNAQSVSHQVGKVEIIQVHNFMRGNDYINLKDLMDIQDHHIFKDLGHTNQVKDLMSKRIIIPAAGNRPFKQDSLTSDALPISDLEALFNFEEAILNGIKSFSLAYWQLLKMDNNLPKVQQTPIGEPEVILPKPERQSPKKNNHEMFEKLNTIHEQTEDDHAGVEMDEENVKSDSESFECTVFNAKDLETLQ